MKGRREKSNAKVRETVLPKWCEELEKGKMEKRRSEIRGKKRKSEIVNCERSDQTHPFNWFNSPFPLDAMVLSTIIFTLSLNLPSFYSLS